LSKKSLAAIIVLAILFLGAVGSIAVVFNELAEAKNEIRNIQLDYNALNNDYSDLQSTYSSLEGEYESLEGECQKLTSDYASLLDKLSEKEAHYTSLEANYSKLQADYTLLESNYSRLESNIASLEEDYNSLMVPLDLYEEAVALKEQEQYGLALEKCLEIVDNYPDSVWESAADNMLKETPPEQLFDEAFKLQEDENFDRAIRLYQAIVDYHSNSNYAEAAEKAIVDCEVAKIAVAEHGELPSFESTGTVTAEGNAVVEVRNAAPYVLTILFSGPESKSITLKPHPEAKVYSSFITMLPGWYPKNWTQTTIELEAGTYKIAAKVDDPDVTPWYGEEDFNSDEKYEELFYVVQTF
jgi:predicted  nucleic acid-binding Zn-ribbon protein